MKKRICRKFKKTNMGRRCIRFSKPKTKKTYIVSAWVPRKRHSRFTEEDAKGRPVDSVVRLVNAKNKQRAKQKFKKRYKVKTSKIDVRTKRLGIKADELHKVYGSPIK